MERQAEPLILVVEDEERLAGLLRDYLVQGGYGVHCLHSGTEVVPWVRRNEPALILLDLMLPGRDGIAILGELRTFSSVPVIIASARGEEVDRLLGLEIGADDYVCKPFSFREVVARVRAVLRRGAPAPGDAAGPSRTSLRLDPSRYTAEAAGRTIRLTVIEFRLLAALAEHPGQVLSRDRLMDRIYPDGRVVSDRTIDSHIRKLRAKLAELLPDRDPIVSVYSAGYKFAPAES